MPAINCFIPILPLVKSTPEWNNTIPAHLEEKLPGKAAAR